MIAVLAGRTLRERPYGAAEALTAGAVTVCLTMSAVLVFPSGSGLYGDALRARILSGLLVCELLLLVFAWQVRAPRLIARARERARRGPAVATLLLGFALLLLIPLWHLAGDAVGSPGEALVFLLLGFAGVLYTYEGHSLLSGPRASQRIHRTSFAGMNLPASALAGLGDASAVMHGMSSVRSSTAEPQRFHAGRHPDITLTPSLSFLALLGVIALLIGAPAVAAVVGSFGR